MANTKTTTPEELAKSLNVSGKKIRAFLRSEFSRKPEAKNTSWQITAAQAKKVREHFAS